MCLFINILFIYIFIWRCVHFIVICVCLFKCVCVFFFKDYNMDGWMDIYTQLKTQPQTQTHTQALTLASSSMDPTQSSSHSPHVIKALFWRARALEKEAFYDVALVDAKVGSIYIYVYMCIYICVYVYLY